MYLPSSHKWKCGREAHTPLSGGIDRLAFLSVDGWCSVWKTYKVCWNSRSEQSSIKTALIQVAKWMKTEFCDVTWFGPWHFDYVIMKTITAQLNLCQFPFSGSELIIMTGIIISHRFMWRLEGANIKPERAGGEKCPERAALETQIAPRKKTFFLLTT